MIKKNLLVHTSLSQLTYMVEIVLNISFYYYFYFHYFCLPMVKYKR
jgi:hypothetical protein